MIDRAYAALRVNLIWLVAAVAAVAISTFWSGSETNSVTANLMFTVASMFGAVTLAKSAWIAHPKYNSIKYFVYVVAVGLVVLGLETFWRAMVVLNDQGEFFRKWISAPINVIKVGVLFALLVVNATLQNRGNDQRLAKQIAIGIGLATVLYGCLFFVVRAILPFS